MQNGGVDGPPAGLDGAAVAVRFGGIVADGFERPEAVVAVVAVVCRVVDEPAAFQPVQLGRPEVFGVRSPRRGFPDDDGRLCKKGPHVGGPAQEDLLPVGVQGVEHPFVNRRHGSCDGAGRSGLQKQEPGVTGRR